MMPKPKTNSIPYHLILIFVLLSIGIGITGRIFYTNQREQIKKGEQDKLSAIADLKVRQIVEWRKERMDDAAIISQSDFIPSHLRQFLEDHQKSDLRQTILSWLLSLQGHTYKSVFLVDAKGAVRLSRDKEEIEKEFVEEAFRGKKPVLSDFHTSGTAGHVHLDLVVPLFMQGGDVRPIGALIMAIDPNQFLYPLIQSWPAPSRTSETLLVKREGDEVLYLNELRHKKNTALSLRLPIGNGQLPAARAVLGKTGVVEGSDYRNMPVLASIGAVPDSPWFLVAKTDTAEIYASLHEHAAFIMIIVTLLIGMAGGGTVLWWRHQSTRFYRRQYELERESRERSQQYEETLKKERDQLQDALDNVKMLRGLLPICASCKKIRDDKGYWKQIEVYIRDHSEAEFSHGICPECAEKLYPEYFREK